MQQRRRRTRVTRPPSSRGLVASWSRRSRCHFPELHRDSAHGRPETSTPRWSAPEPPRRLLLIVGEPNLHGRLLALCQEDTQQPGAGRQQHHGLASGAGVCTSTLAHAGLPCLRTPERTATPCAGLTPLAAVQRLPSDLASLRGSVQIPLRHEQANDAVVLVED